jgi:hypothetical protein
MFRRSECQLGGLKVGNEMTPYYHNRQPIAKSGKLKHRIKPTKFPSNHGSCWTNIVSTLLLLGIRSLNILAHSIAVNTSYRSLLGTTYLGIQALIALDSGFSYSEKVRKAHFLLLLISRISSHSIVPIRVFSLISQFSLTDTFCISCHAQSAPDHFRDSN